MAACAAALIIIVIAWRPTGTRRVKSRESRRVAGYRLIYSDQRGERREPDVIYGKNLRSDRYGLCGKPDFIYQKRLGGRLMPVEVKSGLIKDAEAPREGDLLQLAAYFIIIEEAFGRRPRLGWLVYRDYTFIVRNTAALRKRVLHATDKMREMLENGTGAGAAEAEPSFVKCRHCVCRGTVCGAEAEAVSVRD